jgi:hypothetical protein
MTAHWKLDITNKNTWIAYILIGNIKTIDFWTLVTMDNVLLPMVIPLLIF